MPPPERKSGTIHPYSATDPIPVPEAVESDTDTAWDMWENLTTEPKGVPDPADVSTVPGALDPLAPRDAPDPFGSVPLPHKRK